MLDLNDCRYFAEIADCGGLAAAARKLGIQKSTLSRRITALEKDLGVTLLERGPRHFRLTETGQQFYIRCAAIVRDAELAEQAARCQGSAPLALPEPFAEEAEVDGNAAPLAALDSLVRRQDIVQSYILQNIRKKTFSSGDKLPAERDLSAFLGIARQAVREAIRSLEMSGVLRLERGARGGAFIREIGPDGITYAIRNMLILGRLPLHDLLELRASIFGQAVRLAAERGSEEDFLQLDRNVRQLEHIRRTREQVATVRPSTEFYRIAARASGNRLLAVLVDAIADMIEEMLTQMQTWPFAREGEVARRDTVAAMRARDGKAAEAIIRAHCEETNRVLFDFATNTQAI